MNKNRAYIRLVAPFPPSTNDNWCYSRGRIHLSKQSLSYRDEVYYSIKRQRLAICITEPVRVTVILHPSNNRRRDLDNFGTKALLDALTRARVWQDDSQVKELHLAWGETSKTPYVDLAISFFEGDYITDLDTLLGLTGSKN